ncbi:MAG: hypothetical protein Q8L66_13840 [Caulobacter sp.]|nr:hypothetical protein [Caulobacter sp.]
MQDEEHDVIGEYPPRERKAGQTADPLPQEWENSESLCVARTSRMRTSGAVGVAFALLAFPVLAQGKYSQNNYTGRAECDAEIAKFNRSLVLIRICSDLIYTPSALEPEERIARTDASCNVSAANLISGTNELVKLGIFVSPPGEYGNSAAACITDEMKREHYRALVWLQSFIEARISGSVTLDIPGPYQALESSIDD